MKKCAQCGGRTAPITGICLNPNCRTRRIHPAIAGQSKVCDGCQEPFTPKPGESPIGWQKRHVCSNDCQRELVRAGRYAQN